MSDEESSAIVTVPATESASDPPAPEAIDRGGKVRDKSKHECASITAALRYQAAERLEDLKICAVDDKGDPHHKRGYKLILNPEPAVGMSKEAAAFICSELNKVLDEAPITVRAAIEEGFKKEIAS